MSIVLTITALVAGSGFYMGKSMMNSANMASTNNRLDTIEKALNAYRLANDRIVCPNDPALTAAANPTTYGKETGSFDDDCASGSIATATINGNVISEGAVPVRTLNLPDEFMYDG